MDNWTCIAKTTKMPEAELLAGKIEAAGLSCVVMNKQDRSYAFGYFELYVLKEDASEASQLIKDEFHPESF
ncbi:MAG: DUF2007 domain-containing protein [Cytophagales bacterium]|nr:DUF2007 domain-containing protein [Cytophagales bacterium]